MKVKYPNITVPLTSTDSNVFALIGAVSLALRRAKVPHDEIAQGKRDCLGQPSYDHVLQLIMKTVDVS